jgi:hypothetical protein
VLEDGFCAMHSPTRVTDPAELGRRGGIVSGEVRRAQAKSVRERLRERVEEEMERVWTVFAEGLDATTGYVNGEGEWVEKPDTRTRVTSASALLAEAYGRPPVQLVGDGDRPLSVVLGSAFAAEGDAS